MQISVMAYHSLGAHGLVNKTDTSRYDRFQVNGGYPCPKAPFVTPHGVWNRSVVAGYALAATRSWCSAALFCMKS